MNAQRRVRLAGAAWAIACLLIAGGARPARALTPAGEYEVKAAFLVNFAGFVRWPAAVFANAASPFVVCVAGEDPFGAAFEPFKQNRVAGRSLVVHPIDAAATLPGNCHILFVAGSEAPRLSGILGALGKAPVLTVSDLEDFAVAGGMIRFYLRDEKIRFEINQQAAEVTGLKVDARLLKLSASARGDDRRDADEHPRIAPAARQASRGVARPRGDRRRGRHGDRSRSHGRFNP